MNVEQKLEEMGLELPPPSRPMGQYVPAVRAGNLVFLSGHGPSGAARRTLGKVGRDLTVEQGYEAAKSVALALLASLKGEIGDLDRVRRVVKVLGMVNCTEDFYQQPAVINGASDLLRDVFGEHGRHARSAIGVAALPLGSPVEVELVAQFR